MSKENQPTEQKAVCRLPEINITPTQLVEGMAAYAPISLRRKLNDILHCGSFEPHESLDKNVKDEFNDILDGLTFTSDESILKRTQLARGEKLSDDDKAKLVLTEGKSFVSLNAKKVYSIIKTYLDFNPKGNLRVVKEREIVEIYPQAENLVATCISIAINQLKENEKLGNGFSYFGSGQFVSARQIG